MYVGTIQLQKRVYDKLIYMNHITQRENKFNLDQVKMETQLRRQMFHYFLQLHHTALMLLHELGDAIALLQLELGDAIVLLLQCLT